MRWMERLGIVRSFNSRQPDVRGRKSIPAQQPDGDAGKQPVRRVPLSFLAAVLPVSTLLTGCQRPKPLPEQGSYAQRLYAERCGACHRAYNPASMTAAMWEVQLEAMGAKIVQAGQPALSPAQQLTILHYLTRHAGNGDAAKDNRYKVE